MKRLIIFILLTIALLGFLAIPLCAQTVCDTSKPFCHTATQEKFLLSQVQRAKEYSTQVILLQKDAKADSVRIFALQQEKKEFKGQLIAKDTLISTADQKRAIVVKEKDLAIKQKNRWKAGFISSWAAITAIIVYKEIKREN